MLDQIRQIADAVVEQPFDTSSLGKYRDILDSPYIATLMVIDLCRLAKASLPRNLPPDDLHGQFGSDLISYLAELPQQFIDDIRQQNDFREDIATPWEEARGGAWVDLCCLIQDVWEHQFGPEAGSNLEILRELDCCPGDRILDYGCGAGFYSVPLAMAGRKVDCLDVNSIKMDFLKFRVNRYSLAAFIRIGEPDPPYDAVICFNVLDHLESPHLAAGNLCEWIVDGGILHLIALFPEDGWHQSSAELKNLTFNYLFSQLIPEAAFNASAPQLETLKKRQCSIMVGHRKLPGREASRLYPTLHPAVQILQQAQQEDRTTLDSMRFYIEQCYIDNSLIDILRCCDGTRSIIEICKKFDGELEELAAFFDFLWQKHIVYMSNIEHCSPQ